VADPGRGLPARLQALEEVVALADGRLDDALVNRARAVLSKARERLERGPDTVVAALGGGTGSGKSSLFNALAGEPLVRVGPVRPTTAHAASVAVGDPEPANAVLDWLGVRHRHLAAPSTGLADGLVLVDLPDHDSVQVEHRAEVDRFVERVDVLVWVLDPLKYAQRALHEGYLKLLAAHARVVVVVLNHIDMLSRDDRAAVLHDLRGLLDAEGLGKARLLSTSARTGEGVDQLRAVLNDHVERRRAVAQRIAGDLGNVAGALATQVGAATHPELDAEDLVARVAVAAGVEPLAETGRQTYLDDANDASRPWLSARLGKRLRPLRRPLRRLGRPSGAVRQEVSPIGVRHAVLTLADRAAADLPHPWPTRLHQAAAQVADSLADGVAADLDRVDVHDVRRRRWWRAFALVGTLLETAVLLGVVWLTMLAVVGWLQLPEPPTPQLRGVAWPTVLLVGGAVVYGLVALARRRLVAAGARRHRARIVDGLTQAVRATVETKALEPLRREVGAHADLAAALRSAAGRRR